MTELSKQLEAEGKITFEACYAYLNDDLTTYENEMDKAAADIKRSIKPKFLTKEEIQTLADSVQSTKQNTQNNNDDALVNFGVNIGLNALGYAIFGPLYVGYKALNLLDKCSNGSKAAGGALVATGIAAFFGLDD